jgi:hypothetical protein
LELFIIDKRFEIQKSPAAYSAAGLFYIDKVLEKARNAHAIPN